MFKKRPEQRNCCYDNRRYVYLMGLLFLLLFSLSLIQGCVFSGDSNEHVENIDASTRIVSSWYMSGETNYSDYKLQYIKDKKMYEIGFEPLLKPALDWLKENTKPGEDVLCWWDNGHLIRGYVRRDPVVYAPSRELLSTVTGVAWDQKKLGEYTDSETMTNIAYAFTAESPEITKGIASRYGAKWVFVQRNDILKINGMALLMDDEEIEYIDELGEPTQAAKNKMIYKLTSGETVSGFESNYEDDYVVIYRVV